MVMPAAAMLPPGESFKQGDTRELAYGGSGEGKRRIEFDPHATPRNGRAG
jgi:hypothetical protein